MKYMSKKIAFLLTFLALVVLPGSQTAQAGTLILDADKTDQIRINEVITVPVLLDIDDTLVNTLAGTLSFDDDLFFVESISTSESVVSTWITQPDEKGGEIRFAAMFPNGFSGVMTAGSSTAVPGNLFTLKLRAKESGTAKLQFSDIEAMHDQAQIISPQHAALSLAVEPIRTVTFDSEPDGDTFRISDEDKTPPRSFSPYIINPEMECDSPLYVAFQTTDDGSGLSHYEVGVAETEARLRDVDFTASVSPHVLENVSAGSWVVVKAVDEAGNERTESVQITDSDILPAECATASDSELGNMLYTLSLIVVILLVGMVIWRKRSRV